MRGVFLRGSTVGSARVEYKSIARAAGLWYHGFDTEFVFRYCRRKASALLIRHIADSPRSSAMHSFCCLPLWVGKVPARADEGERTVLDCCILKGKSYENHSGGEDHGKHRKTDPGIPEAAGPDAGEARGIPPCDGSGGEQMGARHRGCGISNSGSCSDSA